MVAQTVHAVRVESIEHGDLNRLTSIKSKNYSLLVLLVDLRLEPVVLHLE